MKLWSFAEYSILKSAHKAMLTPLNLRDILRIHSFLKTTPNMLIFYQTSSNNILKVCGKAPIVPTPLLTR